MNDRVTIIGGGLAGSEAAWQLARRGILFVPDTLVGAGALVAGALRHLEAIDDPGPAIDAIGARVARLLAESRRSGRLPSETARRMALRRLHRGS